MMRPWHEIHIDEGERETIARHRTNDFEHSGFAGEIYGWEVRYASLGAALLDVGGFTRSDGGGDRRVFVNGRLIGGDGFDWSHERRVDGRAALWCPVVDRQLQPFGEGRIGDTAFTTESRGAGMLNACTLCSRDRRTIGDRLHDLNEERARRTPTE